MASKHLTLRMQEESLASLAGESDRQGRSRSELARELIEEGLRMRRHPGIVFRDGIAGRRPALADGPQVWTLVSVWSDIDGTDEERINKTAEWLSVLPHQVREGLHYYAEFKDEIDAWIERNRREAEEAYAEWQRRQAVLSA